MTMTLLPTLRATLLKWPATLYDIARSAGTYLGIAVLVMTFLVLTVPTLRLQMSVLRDAALVALAPEGLEGSIAEIGSAGIAPMVLPVDMGELPARRLARVNPPVVAGMLPEPAEPTEAERTEPVGLLGNLPIEDIEAAMGVFGIDERQLDALEHYIARKYRVANQVVDRILDSALVVGAELKVHPLLILAVMSIESRFNPYAESAAGAQGLMQVMTRVHTDKFEQLGQEKEAAFHPEVNIRIGAQILSDCIRRRGSEEAGLRCYVGATGPNDGGYAAKVQAERRRMALAAKIPLN
jgi:hypothetical protein